MKGHNLVKIIIVVLVSLLLTTPSLAGQGHHKKALPDIPEEWTQFFPEEGFEYNGLKPACSTCPDCVNNEFYFFARRGKVNKVVVYFEGGGACWHPNNCVQGAYTEVDSSGMPAGYKYFYTYYNQIDVNEYILSSLGGIFDRENPKNPFKNWSFVFIPYCTGDIHWGANDAEYFRIDPYGFPGTWTIKHRGFVNFQAVLQWMEKTFKHPKKIFVCGSSAGSYGAMLCFPYIKEAFPCSRAYLLGDAGNGVVDETFRIKHINNWKAQYPEWIFNPEEWSFAASTIAEMYKKIARAYPRSRLAQFTTAWDSVQAYFYNVMDKIENPLQWEAFVPLWCDWHEQMVEYVHETARAAPNYRYYMAAGDYHTILWTDQFYTEKTSGIPFWKWVKAMVKYPHKKHGYRWAKGLWCNVECRDCQDPIQCGAPE